MADEIRATPQNPTLGALAAALRKAQQFAGQYEVDRRIPLLGGTSVDELLSLPGAASLMEDVSYHGPRALIKGGNAATGGIGTFRPDPRIVDVADVALNVTPLGMLAGKGAVRGARALEDATVGAVQRGRIRAAAAKVPQDTAYDPLRQRMEASGNLMYAVKPKGGNWLAGHTDYALQPVRRGNQPVLSGDIVNEAAGRDLFSEYRKVYDQDPTIGLHEWTRKNYPEVYAQIQGPEAAAADRFINTKLDKYIRNEMGTPEDPVRALAEHGVLHFEPQNVFLPSDVAYARTAAGYPRHGMGKSQLATDWEVLSDSAINAAQAGDYLKFMNDTEYAKTIEKNPWLKKVPPETRVYGTAEAETLADDLGFEHLIDELKFSMDPNSGLPANLRLDPKDIDKITVPQAVERVAKINAWRAEEAARAEKAGMLENLQATPRLADQDLQLSFVKKPGGAWVDIPETVDDKGMKLCTSIGKAGGWCTQHEYAAKSYGSGENRLTALVDTEGRPHAQAKITHDVDHMAAVEDATMYMTPEQELAYERHFQKLDRPPELEESLAWLEENAPDAYAVYREVLNSQPKSPPDITELKPVGNSFSSERAQEYAKRDPDYFRKVENSVLKFLNSGEWGKVKDLHHYGIVDLKEPNSLMDAMKTLYGDESNRRIGQEFIDAFNHAVSEEPTAPRFMTQRQLREFIGPVEPLQGYAGGGVVRRVAQGLGEMVEKYAAKESANTAKQRVYHGGTYTPGSEIKKPLFASPNKELASAYIYDDYGNITGKLSEMSHSARNPANEEKLLEVAKKLGIKVDEANVPLSLFDKSMYGQKNVNRLLTELRRQGYDSAEGTDIGAGTSITDKAVVLFPGTKTAPIDGFGGGGIVKGAVKSIGELVDQYVRRVRKMEELGPAGYSVHKVEAPASSEVPGWHISQDLPGILSTGAMTNKAVGANNIQGWVPAHVGGAYFYSDPRLARAKWEDLADVVGDPKLAAEMPVIRAQLRRGNRLVPDEDVSLSVPWQQSYQEGSFATKRPVLINQIDRIYSADPSVTKDMIRDTIIRQRRYAAGGAVNYDPAEIKELARSIVPGYAAGGLVHYDPTEIDTIVSRVKEELHG